MTQIDELHGRITRALERISQQVEGYTAPVAEADPEAANKLAELEAALVAAQEDAKAAQIEANVSREAAAAEAEKLRVAQDETAVLTEQLAAAKDAAEMAQAAVSQLEAEKATEEPVAPAVEEPAAAPEEAAVDNAELEALREELEDEKIANAQLQERLKVLTARQSEASPEPSGDGGNDAELAQQIQAQRESMAQLDAELQRLRSSNAALEETVSALREANAQGVGEPHLINKAMLAELESLRATQAADAAETNAVLAAMEPLLADAAGEENA